MSIEREEFLAHVGYIRADIQQLVARLDELNGRTRDVEGKIAVLQAQAPAHGSAAAWGGGIGGLVVGAIEGARWLWGK